MDESELEEGEISGSDEDTVEVNGLTTSREYSPLPRPSNPALSYRTVAGADNSFRNKPAALPLDSDAEDSDGSCDGEMQNKRVKLESSTLPPPQPSARSVKRNVWADVLLEQQISSSMKTSGTIEPENTDVVERGVESYKPSGESRTADQGDVLGEAGQGELWDVNYDGESNNSLQHRKGKKNSIHKRIDYDSPRETENFYQTEELPEEVTADDEERVVARYIARCLGEQKVVLIERVTRFAGREKALQLFHATRDIEAAGGMLTLSGSSRRSPGGVFLYLLKKDKSITKQTINEIFALEKQNQKFAKKVIIRDRQMRKRKYYNKTVVEEASSADPMDSSTVNSESVLRQPDTDIGVG